MNGVAEYFGDGYFSDFADAACGGEQQVAGHPDQRAARQMALAVRPRST
jgi:hypothetical protein